MTHIFLPADILDISLLAIVSLYSDAGISQEQAQMSTVCFKFGGLIMPQFYHVFACFILTPRLKGYKFICNTNNSHLACLLVNTKLPL